MSDEDGIPENADEFTAAHIRAYLEKPEETHIWDSSVLGIPGPLTVLLLTTTGRKSGKQRHTVIYYRADSGSYVVVASKMGNPEHPLWYRNLQAQPVCEIRVGPLRVKARATTLAGAERERLWQAITDQVPIYAEYQTRTRRQIPLVRLQPIDPLAQIQA